MDYKGKLILAKEALESGSYDKETIEYIFPELKESEDERIRKAIVKMISDIDGGFPFEKYGIIKKEAITWLEKQGEKESKKTSIWKHWKDGIAGNGASKTIYLIKNGNDYSLSSCLGYECDYILLSDLDKLMLSEKQGEQSHCNGEVNDEALQRQLQIWFDKGKCSGRDEVIFHPENFGLQKQGEQKPDFCHHEVDFSNCSEEYRKAYYDGWNNCNQQHAQLEAEQKPVDKKYTFNAIPRLLSMIQPTGRAKAYCQKLIDILIQEGYNADANIVGKCLKQMNGEKVAMATMDEQKPAAWSEEDERRMQQIISDLEQCTVPGFPIYIGGIELEINWLKSLKERMI